MDLRRIRPADWATGAFGVALLVATFTPWYRLSDQSLSAWQAFGFVDKWLALLIALALAIPIVTARRESPAIPVALDVITSAVGVVAIPWVLYRILNQPGPNEGIDFAWGSIFGFVCVVGVTAAAWQAMKDERGPGLRPPPEARTMPAPPAGAEPVT